MQVPSLARGPDVIGRCSYKKRVQAYQVYEALVRSLSHTYEYTKIFNGLHEQLYTALSSCLDRQSGPNCTPFINSKVVLLAASSG